VEHRPNHQLVELVMEIPAVMAEHLHHRMHQAAVAVLEQQAKPVILELDNQVQAEQELTHFLLGFRSLD
jgi:hypothetical protein